MRERSIKKLELIRTQVGVQRGWLTARWTRADDSHGELVVWPRLETAERWYIARSLLDQPTLEKLRDIPLARITAAINAAGGELRAWIENNHTPETIERARREAARRPKVERPRKRGELTDAFYRSVADAYRAAAAAGLPPSKTIADESDAPPGSVNRWIAEARRRGYLAAGERGRVTT